MAAEILLKSYIADGAITPGSIVKVGSDEDHVTPATGVNDVVLGVASGNSAAGNYAAGERVDVLIIGSRPVIAGAAFAAGVYLTSDATGRAIAAAPAAGVNNNIVGIALEAATAAGDQPEVHIRPGRIQG